MNLARASSGVVGVAGDEHDRRDARGDDVRASGLQLPAQRRHVRLELAAAALDEHRDRQVGLGAEAMVTPQISLGVEYLYTSLDDADAYTVRAGNSGTTPAFAPRAPGSRTSPSASSTSCRACRSTAGSSSRPSSGG